MLSTQEDPNSRFKLAQLRHLVAHPSLTSKTNSNIIALVRAVNEILTDDVNINYKVTINPYHQKWKIHLKNCTALHFLASDKHDIDVFKMLLERGADFTMKNDNGQTALHLVTTNYLNKLKKFSTIKNRNAPVDFPATNLFRAKGPKINHNSFINSVLSAHMKFQNSVNPRDNNGLSHLHAACVANHAKALELFLDNEASVNEAVNFDAPQFAGYTPLHFAVMFHSFEVTEMLMSRGANINARTAEGLTPLDILVKQALNNYEDMLPHDSKQTFEDKILKNEKVIKSLLEKQSILTIGLSSLHVACTLKDLTIAEQLLNQDANINYVVPMESPLRPGNTALHFAAYNSIEAVKMLMKRGAKLDVANAKGFTPLDICVDRYSLQEICDVAPCDENWKTIRMTDEKTSLLDFVRVSAELLQFKVFLQKNMQNMAVPSDSLILPGCTMLHLAVIFSAEKNGENPENKFDDNIVRECLKSGLDINIPNARGQTPIHLAFRLGKDNIVQLLLQDLDKLDQLVDLVDENNLSYLLIACAMEDESLVEKLLKTSTDPNVAYKGRSVLMEIIESGTTPLHVAAAYGSQPMVEMLLKHGADLHATDANGMTPIHYLLQLEGIRIGKDVVKILFNALLENPKDCVADQVGLNHLHIACYVGNVGAVKKLLDIGSNVNAVISYQNASAERYLSRQQLRLLDFPMCTPLHLANYRPVVEIIELLMRRGADVFASATKFSIRHIKPLESPVMLENKDITRIFVSVLWKESELQKRMKERWGLTRLHIACHMKNEEAIKILLKDGLDVNSQMHADAEVFAGCTPLHLLLTVSTCCMLEYYHYRPTYSLDSMIRLLLDHGADVTIANAKKNTPVHLLSRAYNTDNKRYAETLLNAQKDFGINPVNSEGESHFHIACKWLFIEVIDKFFQRGTVDVNQRDDLFAKLGETPLHYTCWQDVRVVDWAKFLQTIDMLFAHGADPAVKDTYGDTPLHKPGLSRVPNMIEVIDQFIRHGADIKSANIMGQTILNKWNILNPLMNYGSLFIKYGYPINSWNDVTREGYIAKIFLSQINKKVENNAHFQKLLQSSDVRAVDKLGRTVIHNSVAVLPPKYQGVENYIYAIKCFISLGVDIDHQDQSGQTALHYAVQMENEMGVEALLKYGTDINITDANGMPAFSYYTEYNKAEIAFSGVKKIVNMLNCHVNKLQHLKLEVNQINENLAADPQLIRCRVLDAIRDEDPYTILQPFFNQVEMAKILDVGVRSLTLFDFLNETGGVTLYSYLPPSEQNIIDDFFKSIATNEFGELMGIIKLQFRKMKARLALIDAALISLRKLLGFSFPGLCEEISRYLTNTNLKNLMAC